MQTNTVTQSQAAIRAVLDSGGLIFPSSILTVGERVKTGRMVGRANPAFVAALAAEPESDATQYTDAQAGVVVAESDSIDAGSVEHTRQSRLRAWQEQRPSLNSRRDDA